MAVTAGKDRQLFSSQNLKIMQTASDYYSAVEQANEADTLDAPCTRTQNREILKHLEKGGTVTQTEAYHLFGCTRLSGRIFDLRKDGHDIQARWESGVNRLGHLSRWKRYYLAEKTKAA